MEDDLSAFAVGLPARGGMEVYWLNGSVVMLFGKLTAFSVPNDWGPLFAGCSENVTSCRLYGTPE
jgi:hypothetical protein